MSKSVSALVVAASEKFQTLTADDLASPETQMDVLGDVYLEHLTGAGAAARRKAQSYFLRIKTLLRHHGVTLAWSACENLAMLALVDGNSLLAEWVATSYGEMFTREQRLATIRDATGFAADCEHGGDCRRFRYWQFAYQVLLDEAPPSYQDEMWNLTDDLLLGLEHGKCDSLSVTIEQVGADEVEFIVWLIGQACGTEQVRVRDRYVQALMFALVSVDLVDQAEAALRRAPEAQRALFVQQLQDCVHEDWGWGMTALLNQIKAAGDLADQRDLEEWRAKAAEMPMRREADLLHRLTGETSRQVDINRALDRLEAALGDDEPNPEALDRLDEALRPEE
jgi:hypothetical protein